MEISQKLQKRGGVCRLLSKKVKLILLISTLALLALSYILTSCSEAGIFNNFDLTVSEKNIKNVEFSEGMISPEFSPDVYNYVVNVPNQINLIKIKLTYPPEIKKVSLKANFNGINNETRDLLSEVDSDNITLNPGSNILEALVYITDDINIKYTFNVIRNEKSDPTATSLEPATSTSLEASSTTTVESTTTTDTYVSTTLETTTTTTVSPTTTSTVDPTTSTIEPITTSTIAPTTSFEPTTSTTTIIDETTTTTTTYVSTTIVALTTTTANVSTTTTTIEPTTTTTTTGAPTTTTIITTTTTSTTVASTSTTTYASTTTSSTSTTTTTIADAIPPADPSITINPTTPTSGNVTVAITFSGDSAVKQYKIGTGSYQSYSAPFTVSEDVIVYAKAQDSVGNWSNEVNYSITNIDKVAPTATVSYSTTAPTNGNVTATITPSETVTITNNSGLTTYTFTANGSFTFNFTDTTGNTGSATATVNNIDKTSPTATVAYSTTASTNGSVTATITSSESVTITNNSGLTTYTFTANGSFTFNFTDAVGNTGSIIATVGNIDKTAPTATVAYSTTAPTNGDVIATITPSESVTITNNEGLTTRTFSANGSFTFEFTDSAGNTGSATAMVNNIDKTAPADPSIAINPTTPTSGDVTVTITFSGDSAVKQYKIGTSSYQSYAAPFTVSEDTTIYAKAQDAVGNWSGEVNYSVTNIDRGDFNVTITLVSPIEAVIDFGTYNGMLDKNIGQVLNVTATLDGATNWEWYLDNDIIGTASANCSVDSSNYDPGPYNLTVFAVKGGLTYSGTIKINIEN